MRAHSSIRIALLATSVAVLAACGGDDSTGNTAMTQETKAGGAAAVFGAGVSPPEGAVVLSVEGEITTTNVSDKLAFDLASLDRLDVVTGEVFEPWTQTDLGFRGVRLGQILDLAGARSDSTIELAALDDYVVVLDRSEIDDTVIVATQLRDGSAIPVDQGGPARLLFLDDDRAVADPENWIWSIATVTVR